MHGTTVDKDTCNCAYLHEWFSSLIIQFRWLGLEEGYSTCWPLANYETYKGVASYKCFTRKKWLSSDLDAKSVWH